MQVLAGASASSSTTHGTHGAYAQNGSETGVTLLGLKPLASTSLPSTLSLTPIQALISSYTATTVASSTHGPISTPVMPMSMQSSSLSSHCVKNTNVTSRHNTCEVTTIPQTALLATRIQMVRLSRTQSGHCLSPSNSFSQARSSLTSQSLMSSQHISPMLHPSETESPRDPSARLRKARSELLPLTHSHNIMPTPRPYFTDLSPSASPLRPHCLASQRLLQWHPCTPVPTNLTPLTLPDHVRHRVFDVLSSAWAPSTLSTYASGLLAFHVFCDSLAIAEEARSPSGHVLVAAFIASLAGRYSSSTITNYVAGLKAWHVIHSIPWTVDDAIVRKMLVGADRLAPPQSKRPPRQPYTVAHILALRQQLRLDDPLDAAVFACLTVAFYCCARVGEFTVPSVAAFDPNRHIKMSNVRDDCSRSGHRVRTFFLPATKTKPHGEDVACAVQSGLSDPIAAFSTHVHINCPPPAAHVFAYRCQGGWTPLSRHVFLRRIQQAADQAGIPFLQGHGIRIGSTLEYLLRGINFEVVKSIGRWKSDAFLVYLRRHAQILAPYLQAQPPVLDAYVQFINSSIVA